MKDKRQTKVVTEQMDEQSIKLLNGHDTVIVNGDKSTAVNGDADIEVKNGESVLVNRKDSSSTSDLYSTEESEDNTEVCDDESHLHNKEYNTAAPNSYQKEPLTIYYEYQEPESVKELHTVLNTFNVDRPIEDSTVDNIHDLENETERPLLQKSTKENDDILANLKDEFPLKLNLTSRADKWIYDIVDSSTYTETTISRTQSCLDDPPDGGWGWVVTFSAFMVGLILDGISFSFGVFFKELYVYFNESKSLTSWIISVMNGTYLAIGKCTSQTCIKRQYTRHILAF